MYQTRLIYKWKKTEKNFLTKIGITLIDKLQTVEVEKLRKYDMLAKEVRIL